VIGWDKNSPCAWRIRNW